MPGGITRPDPAGSGRTAGSGHDRDSCHTVWIQFHEDLLATLGIPRGTDAWHANRHVPFASGKAATHRRACFISRVDSRTMIPMTYKAARVRTCGNRGAEVAMWRSSRWGCL